LSSKVLLEKSRIFVEFKGSLTEQFVLQELVYAGVSPFYWGSEGKAEVDFVYATDLEVFPLEVKAEENLQAKSLRTYYDKYVPQIALRCSMKPYRKEDWVMNIPLYMISEMQKLTSKT